MGGISRMARWAVIAGGGCIAGLGIGILLPSIEVDDPFWRAFWSGPPMAGILTVVGAVIAFAAASIAARTARHNAERAEWWQRAQWALDLARSSNSVDRAIGVGALGGLRKQATESEGVIVAAVTDAIILEQE